MQTVIDSLFARPGLTISVGAFLCAVALFYLVMQRTRRRRLRKAGQAT